MEKPEQLYKLFNRYLNNQCTLEETEVLMKYFHTDDQYFLYQMILGVLEKEDDDTALLPLPPHVYRAIKKRIHPVAKVKSLWLRIPGVAAAAAILFIITAGILFYTSRRSVITRNAEIVNQTDIAPGKNKAVLTLGDGRAIDLSDDKTGVLIDTGKLTYNDGSLVQNSVSASSLSIQQRIILSTPKGGTYQVVLSDGTKVWLNAASSLKFPSTFSTLSKSRVVELSGEAYFEVAKVVVKGHDKGSRRRDKSIKMPFIVVSRGQQVEVLGTHFNINSYADEPLTKTTLLEGSVQVYSTAAKSPFHRNGVMLRPGEQSGLSVSGHLTVSAIDTTGVTDWKNGNFVFEQEPIEIIMRKISRWYNVAVVYEGEKLEEKYSGHISRSENLSQILSILEKTNTVKFKIEGRTVLVIKK